MLQLFRALSRACGVGLSRLPQDVRCSIPVDERRIGTAAAGNTGCCGRSRPSTGWVTAKGRAWLHAWPSFPVEVCASVQARSKKKGWQARMESFRAGGRHRSHSGKQLRVYGNPQAQAQHAQAFGQMGREQRMSCCQCRGLASRLVRRWRYCLPSTHWLSRRAIPIAIVEEAEAPARTLRCCFRCVLAVRRFAVLQCGHASKARSFVCQLRVHGRRRF